MISQIAFIRVKLCIFQCFLALRAKNDGVLFQIFVLLIWNYFKPM